MINGGSPGACQRNLSSVSLLTRSIDTSQAWYFRLVAGPIRFWCSDLAVSQVSCLVCVFRAGFPTANSHHFNRIKRWWFHRRSRWFPKVSAKAVDLIAANDRPESTAFFRGQRRNNFEQFRNNFNSIFGSIDRFFSHFGRAQFKWFGSRDLLELFTNWLSVMQFFSVHSQTCWNMAMSRAFLGQ